MSAFTVVVNVVILMDAEADTEESGEDADAEIAAATEQENCDGDSSPEMDFVKIGGSIINVRVGVEGPKTTSSVVVGRPPC